MADKKSDNNKIVKYKRPLNVSLGVGIFLVIFVYIVIIVISYATSSHVSGYEVKAGSLAVNNTYRGLILRKEMVFTSQDSGYVNYYAREGERVSAREMVYTVDESGKLNDLLTSGYETGNSLTNADLSELRTDIINYRNGYSDHNFASVYDFKHNAEGTVQKLANRNILSGLNKLSDQAVLDLVNFSYSDESGIVVYSTDGYEEITTDQITKDMFNEENYSKNQLTSGDLIDTGDPVYKLVTEENWSIIIPMEKDRWDELSEETYVKVRFLKTGDESWGAVKLFEKESDYYCQLSFTNSMISYCTDRFLDIELLLQSDTGLKIPISSIVDKDFYLIPVQYLTKGADEEEESGFMRETFLEDNTVSTELVPAEIYYSTDEYYYVDTTAFRLGDYIIPPNSGQKYAIGQKGTLTGVYNMNKGYADFTQIKILYKNKEYAIVKSNTEYGLSVYDHIVLDGASVNDDDFVFE